MADARHGELRGMEPGDRPARVGNPQEFNIGHLKLRSIEGTLDYLQHILDTGYYDIFGVTGINFSRNQDLRLMGYDVEVYPNSFGRRGIAIYISHRLIQNQSINSTVQNGIEIADLYLNLNILPGLNVTFLYRPNMPSINRRDLRNLLGEKGSRWEQQPLYRPIVMGNMNINWNHEDPPFPTAGMQQLIRAVTRSEPPPRDRPEDTPLTGSTIDHIWIANQGQYHEYGVDTYSHDIVYKLRKEGVVRIPVSLSDHCIIWIALEYPGESPIPELELRERGNQNVRWPNPYLKTGYLHREGTAFNTVRDTLQEEDFDVFAVTGGMQCETGHVPGYRRWFGVTRYSQILLFARSNMYGNLVTAEASYTDTIGSCLHISLSYIPEGGEDRKQVHMLFLKSHGRIRPQDLSAHARVVSKYVRTTKDQVMNGGRFLVFGNLNIWRGRRQPILRRGMRQLNPRVDVNDDGYSDQLWVDRQTLQKMGERDAKDVPRSTNQLIWCELNIENLRFVLPS